MAESKAPALDGELVEPGKVEYITPMEEAPFIYTNSVQMKMSVYDLALELGIVAAADPQRTRVRPVARVVMSPQHAKALASILNAHIQAYERLFGPITDSPKGTQGE